MIPIRDENPTSRTPWVTLAFIVLNVLAFLLWEPTFATGPDAERRQTVFFFCNALIPWEITHQEEVGEGGPEAVEALAEQFGQSRSGAREDQEFLAQACSTKVWWQSLLTAMFLHAGWLHIGGNMLFLWVFGNNVEDRIGHVGYAFFYLAAGIVASFAQIATDADSVIPNLGASGAVSGVLGAYLVMFPRRRVLTLITLFFITAVYLPAVVVLGLWFVLQLFSGVAAMSESVNVGGGVAFWAHIGGFVFGAVVALLFFPKEGLAARPPPPRPDLFGRRARRRPPPPPGWP